MSTERPKPDSTSSEKYELPSGLNVEATGRKWRKQASSGGESAELEHERFWVAPSVEIWGDVRLDHEVSIWFQSVLRGDVNFISIGARTNIQDGTIIHVANQYSCQLGTEVTVGHRALLHACTVEDLVLVGMSATVLTGAVVGRGSVIAAGAVVKENEIIPPFTLMAGVPARKIRSLDPQVTEISHRRWAEKYVRLARTYRNTHGH